MTQTDEVQTLSKDDQGNKSQEDPSNQAWSVVAIHICHIAETDCVKLALTTTTRSVNREENWPCNYAANETDEDQKLEKSQEEVAIE